MAEIFWKKYKSLQIYFGFRIGSVLFFHPVNYKVLYSSKGSTFLAPQRSLKAKYFDEKFKECQCSINNASFDTFGEKNCRLFAKKSVCKVSWEIDISKWLKWQFSRNSNIYCGVNWQILALKLSKKRIGWGCVFLWNFTSKWTVLNRRYLKDSTEGGPCRSEFWVQIFFTELHWLEGLRSQKFLKSVQPFRRYGHFWILALKWGQNWCDWKKSPFFSKISCPFRKIICHVKTTLWIRFWRFGAPTGCAIKYRRQK